MKLFSQFNPTAFRRSRAGFSLFEVAIAVVLITVVSTITFRLVASSMAETSWATHMALADAWLDREACLMRRLEQSALASRGFVAGGSTETDVPLAFRVVSGAKQPDIYTANEARRQVTNGSNGQFTYTVGLKINLQGVNGNRTYQKARTVIRQF